MKKADPFKEIDPARSVVIRGLIETARAEPGEWFDVSEELGATSFSSALYQAAGRYFTPFRVTIRKDRTYIRWGEK